jgi:hypothetical protein
MVTKPEARATSHCEPKSAARDWLAKLKRICVDSCVCREAVRVLVRERAAAVPDGHGDDPGAPVVQVRGARHGQVVAAAAGHQALHRARPAHGQRRQLVAPAPRRRAVVHGRQAQGAPLLALFGRPSKIAHLAVRVSQGRVGHMVECTKQAIRALREAASRGDVEIGAWMTRLTGDIISRTEFDTSYENGKRIFHLLEDLQRLTARSSRHLWIPGSQWVIPFPSSVAHPPRARRLVSCRARARSLTVNSNNQLLYVLVSRTYHLFRSCPVSFRHRH